MDSMDFGNVSVSLFVATGTEWKMTIVIHCDRIHLWNDCAKNGLIRAALLAETKFSKKSFQLIVGFN